MEKCVAAVFTISMVFAVFADMSHFPKPRPTALVSIRLDYHNSLHYNTANKDIAKPQFVQNYLAMVVMHSPHLSRSQCHFRTHCIGSLCTIALFSRFVQQLIKPSHQHNRHRNSR